MSRETTPPTPWPLRGLLRTRPHDRACPLCCPPRRWVGVYLEVNEYATRQDGWNRFREEGDGHRYHCDTGLGGVSGLSFEQTSVKSSKSFVSSRLQHASSMHVMALYNRLCWQRSGAEMEEGCQAFECLDSLFLAFLTRHTMSLIASSPSNDIVFVTSYTRMNPAQLRMYSSTIDVNCSVPAVSMISIEICSHSDDRNKCFKGCVSSLYTALVEPLFGGTAQRNMTRLARMRLRYEGGHCSARTCSPLSSKIFL